MWAQLLESEDTGMLFLTKDFWSRQRKAAQAGYKGVATHHQHEPGKRVRVLHKQKTYYPSFHKQYPSTYGSVDPAGLLLSERLYPR
jgi:hypothetical protein